MPVSIIFTSSDRAALQSIAKLEAKVIGLQQKLKGVGTAGKKAGKQTSEAFGPRAIASFKTYAAGLIGVGGVLAALRLISSEYRSQIELQKDAAGTQITLADARNKLFFNLAGASPELLQKLKTFPGELAGRSNISEIEITKALASGFSAASTSGKDAKLVLSAVELATKVSPGDPEILQTLVGAGLDLQQVTGSRDPEVLLGFLRSVGAASRVPSLEDQAKNLPAPLASIVKSGATAGEAGAFLGALSTVLADVTGRVSGQAGLVFANQLDEFFESNTGSPIGKKGRDLFGEFSPDQSTLPGGFTERIQFLRDNPEARKVFLDNANFGRAKAKNFLRDFISDGESKIITQFEQNIEDRFSGGNEGFRKVGRDFLSGKAAFIGAPEITAEAGRIAAQGVEAGELAPTGIAGRRARAGAIREGLIKTLKLSGLTALETQARVFVGFDLPDDEPLEEANRLLKSRVKSLLFESEFGNRRGLVSPDRARDLDVESDRLLDIIEKNNELLEKIAANTAKTADKSGGGTLGRVDDDPGAGARG